MWPVPFAYSKLVVEHDVNEQPKNSVGIANDTATAGIIKVTYHNDQTDIIPIAASGIVYVRNIKRIWATTTTAGLIGHLHLLFA